jgi:hypothetical protein
MNDEIIHKIKGYLGYEVLLSFSEEMLYFNKKITLEELMNNLRFCLIIECMQKGDIKLILRPLEDLTEKELIVVNNNIMYNFFGLNIDNYEKHQFKNGKYIKHHLDYIRHDGHLRSGLFNELVEYLNSIHIDYQGLIGQGLAIKKEVEND